MKEPKITVHDLARAILDLGSEAKIIVGGSEAVACSMGWAVEHTGRVHSTHTTRTAAILTIRADKALKGSYVVPAIVIS